MEGRELYTYKSNVHRKSHQTGDFLAGKCRVTLCIVAVLIIISLVTFLLVYFFVIRANHDENGRIGGSPAAELVLPIVQGDWQPHCPSSPAVNDRYDCHPEIGGSEKKCEDRGCCWLPIKDQAQSPINVTNNKSKNPRNIPVCIYPDNYGYVVASDTTERQFLDGFEVQLTRLGAPSRYGDDAQQIKVRVHMETSTRLRIKFFSPSDENEGDTEPLIPVEKEDLSPDLTKQKLYAVSYRKNSIPFGLEVRRVATETVIFSTSVPGFTFANQFRQLTARLPSQHIFGLGPLVAPSANQTSSWHTWSLFAGGHVDSTFIKSHGGHPVYLCLENNGNAHAVLLHNSHAIDYQLQPTPALTFRAIGGSLDFYIFLGPTPEDVVQQYHTAVGRPFFPPYWMLGVQISFNGVSDTEGIKNSLRDWQRHNLSYDVVSLASEYKNKAIDFTLDHRKFTNLLIFTEELATNHRYLDVDVDPAISAELPDGTYLPYDEGIKAGIFVNSSFKKFPLVGLTNSGGSVFVDFGNKASEKWWTRNLEKLKNLVRYQSLTVTDNQPLNLQNGSTTGCAVDHINNPPYLPSTLQKRKLFWQTICMDSWQFQNKKHVRHYSVHNLYGHNMNKVTNRALSSLLPKERRSAVVSQSTYTGSGKYCGFWAFNINRNWTQLEHSLSTMLSYNLYGITMVGTAICGSDVYEEDEELCMRWMQLGAFYPLARIIQDPMFCSEHFGKVAKIAIDTRYQLLPYLYTLLHKASTQGGTVVRHLFHEFYEDKTTYNITNQFMWGSALMIIPVLHKSVRLMKVYLPNGFWYIYHTGTRLMSKGEWVGMEAPLERILLLIRGGYAVPTLPPGTTTFNSRKNHLHLVIALDHRYRSTGMLYWDDGVTKDSYLNKEYILVNFTIRENKLQVSGQQMKAILPNSLSSAYFDSVDIMGVPYKPLIVAISGTVGVLGSKQFIWDPSGKVLQIRHIIIPLSETVQIEWRWTDY
ncbi:hypothetical protein CHUAL_003718 [Chamberlinius hualienensis]